MGEELSLSLEETNAIRRKLGLKPIPTGSTDSGEQSKEAGTSQVSVEGTPSGQEQQQEQNSDDAYHFLDRHKLSLLRKKLRNVRGGISSKPFTERSDEEDDKEWLTDIKDRTLHWKVKLTYNELDETDDIHNGDDIRTMRVENFDAIKPGEKVILTLRDDSKTAQESKFNKEDEAEEEEDILENEQLKHGMETAKALSLRRMNQERKRGRLHLTSMTIPLTEEEEEENKGSNGNYSDIVIGATSSISQTALQTVTPAPPKGKLSVKFEEILSEDETEYSDFKKIKTKRRKMGTDTSSRKKPTARLPYEMKQVILDDDDNDGNNQEDEDWLYGRFSRAKSSNRVRVSPTALEIAESVKKEQQELRKRQEELGRIRERREGIVMDENKAFFDSLKSELLESTNTSVPEKQTDKEITTTGVQHISSQIIPDESSNVEGTSREPPETLNFSGGLASTLQFLRERHVLPASDDSQLRDERLSYEQHIELQKLRDSMQGNLGTDRAGETERNHSVKRLEEIQRERLKHYNPTVNLVYRNDKGTELTTKEAWKVLSKKFHEFKERKKRYGRRREGSHKKSGPHS